MTRLPLRTTLDGRAFLNLGCGARFHPEWNNLDFVSLGSAVIKHDILSGLPYGDESLDLVYSAHFLEHLSAEQIRAILVESFRLLKRGGILRVVLPDLEYNARLYLECLRDVRARGTAEAREHYEWARLNLFEQMVRERPGGALAEFLTRSHLDPDFIRTTIAGTDYDLFQQSTDRPPKGRGSPWRNAKAMVREALTPFLKTRVARIYLDGLFRSSGELHKWMYDSFSLTNLLETIGYIDVRSMGAGESSVPAFGRYFLDVDSSGAVHKPNSLFVEARRS